MISHHLTSYLPKGPAASVSANHLVCARAREERARATLTSRILAADRARGSAGGTGPLTPEAAARQADTALREGSDQELGTPLDALRAYLHDVDREAFDQDASADELVEMLQGARQLRDWLDEFEAAAGRAARVEGVIVRHLANAVGVSEHTRTVDTRRSPEKGSRPVCSPWKRTQTLATPGG